MRLRSLTYAELVSCGVNPSFARILTDPKSYHADLSIIVGTTDWDYYIPHGVSEIIPLWDCNADSYVRWARNGEIEYVLLLHDEPQAHFVARSEQGIMAQLWQNWIEFKDDENEIRQFANAIGFRYCDEAIALLDSDIMAYRRWIAELKDDPT